MLILIIIIIIILMHLVHPCMLVLVIFLQSMLRRLLFPALVAPAMTTWTPLRSRSPLLSSFRCRCISACKSYTDLSTVCQRERQIEIRGGSRTCSASFFRTQLVLMFAAVTLTLKTRLMAVPSLWPPGHIPWRKLPFETFYVSCSVDNSCFPHILYLGVRPHPQLAHPHWSQWRPQRVQDTVTHAKQRQVIGRSCLCVGHANKQTHISIWYILYQINTIYISVVGHDKIKYYVFYSLKIRCK